MKSIGVMGIIFCLVVNVIAAASIGIQYYNKCKDKLDDEKMMKNNFTYLIVLLVCALLLGMGGCGLAIMNKKKAIAQTVLQKGLGASVPRGVPRAAMARSFM